MKFFVVKGLNNNLKAASDFDMDLLKKLKAGKDYQCEITQPRNIKFHRKYFTLINLLFENQERYKNIETLRKDLIIEAGYYDEYVDLYGEVKREAKSIKFSKMTESDFQDLYSKSIDVIVTYFNFDKQLIVDAVSKYF